MGWTSADLLAFEARRGKQPAAPADSVPPGEEDRLHNQIIEECKRRGWLAFHGSMAHSTYRTLGEPDFIILADAGRVFWFECKSSTGKLTTEQLGIHAWMAKLGHSCRVVRSLREFIALTSLHN